MMARLTYVKDRAAPRQVRPLRWLVLAIFALALALGSNLDRGPAEAQAQPSPASAEKFVAGEILVKFKPGTPASTVAAAHRKYGGQVKATIPKIDVQVVGVDRGQEKARVAAYEQNPNVKFAETNGLYREAEHAGPNDPRVPLQWQYHNTGQTGGTKDADIYAFEAWHTTSGSASVPIAILDTGIKETHEDFKKPDGTSKIVQNVNFTTSATVDDLRGHGTHVAGSAAAFSDNGVGVAGTCGECALYNVKVLRDDGLGAWSWIASGIVWSADNGAKAINLSFGAASPSSTAEEAVNYAWGKGAVLTAAAGNSGTSDPFYPAYYDRVIAVGATDHNDQKASFSNYGSSWVDVAAPGVGILSTSLQDGGYETKDGTSMASPHAAGLAGLLWSNFAAGATNQDVRDAIESQADQLGDTGGYWAEGRINACKALGGSCSRADTTAPTVSSVTPTEGATEVGYDTNVAVAFSEPMDKATLTTARVTLAEDGAASPLSATVAVSADDRTVVLDPSTDLKPLKKYTATVKGGTVGVKDLAGNPLAADKVWTFTTRPDTTAPAVSNTSPANGATEVARDTNVTAAFSEAMDPATLTTSTIKLVRTSDGKAVSATVTVSPDGKTTTLNPYGTSTTSHLSSRTKYTATVKGGSGGVKDLAGNPLATDKIWTFTTRK